LKLIVGKAAFAVSAKLVLYSRSEGVVELRGAWREQYLSLACARP